MKSELFIECPNCKNIIEGEVYNTILKCPKCNKLFKEDEGIIIHPSDLEITYEVYTTEPNSYLTLVKANSYEEASEKLWEVYNKDKKYYDTKGETTIDDIVLSSIKRKSSYPNKKLEINNDIIEVFSELEKSNVKIFNENYYITVFIEKEAETLLEKHYSKITFIEFLKDFINECDSFTNTENLFNNVKFYEGYDGGLILIEGGIKLRDNDKAHLRIII